MKTIIAATDFSENSRNAVWYAAALAKAIKARLVLFNHFDFPLPATDLPGMVPVYVDELAQLAEARLKELKEEINQKFDIPVECSAQCGSAIVDVEELAQKLKADLIVTGFKGSSPLVNTLFGGFTAPLMRRGRVSLLAVPPEARFRHIDTILLACDDHFMEETRVLRPLLGLATDFNARIEVVTMRPEGQGSVAVGKPGEASNLEKALAPLNHNYIFGSVEDVPETILGWAIWDSADIVAMIPHHHSWLANVLHPSMTQRVATSVKVPLLVLGEKVDHEQGTA